MDHSTVPIVCGHGGQLSAPASCSSTDRWLPGTAEQVTHAQDVGSDGYFTLGRHDRTLYLSLRQPMLLPLGVGMVTQAHGREARVSRWPVKLGITLY